MYNIKMGFVDKRVFVENDPALHLLNNNFYIPNMADAMESLFKNIFNVIDYVFSMRFFFKK
jgi:hypothetical protein|tara:strand:+ start:26 stop:208 length:183 start_codon:yes stop_codon:yes gene_type:complete